MSSNFERSTRQYVLTSAQKVAVTGTSAQSGVIGFYEVLVFATADMWLTWGTNPTAVADTAGNFLLSAGEKFHLQIDPSFKIAAIQSSAAGSLHIIPTSGG